MFFSQKYLMFPLCLIQLPWHFSRAQKTNSRNPACPLDKQLLNFACCGQVLLYISRKHSILPHSRDWNFLGVGGKTKKIVKTCMKLKGNFQRRGRILEEIPSVGEVWALSGTTNLPRPFPVRQGTMKRFLPDGTFLSPVFLSVKHIYIRQI